MTTHTPAGASTPVDWIDAAAAQHPGKPALVFADGVVSYSQLLHAVDARKRSLPADHGRGAVVDVAVRSDLASIVEVLAIQAAGGCPLPYADQRPDVGDGTVADAVLCVSTSGSSGGPRIVPLTMANLAAAVGASRGRLGTSGEDRWLVPLPMHHIGGLSVLFRVFEAGAVAVVHPFSDGLGDLIHRTEPTIASMVPTMVRRLLASSPDDLSAIGHILTGGGPATGSLVSEAAEAGVELLPTYGMTEASSQVATVAPGDEPVGVGKPLEGFGLAINAEGRIVVDGPAVFGGYLGDPRRDGAFTTNDLGEIDADGNVIVFGRADDVAVTGGENVLLPAVEETIRRYGGVTDVAVVAVADPEWGQAVCAVVVGAGTEAVAERVRPHLERHQMPRRWKALDAVPLLENGKPDVAAIRRVFAPR